jgi:basic membrane protein A
MISHSLEINMTRRSALMLSLGSVGALVLSGCSSTSSNQNGSSAGSSDSDLSSKKIALILPGSIDDQGWNASNNAGAQTASDQLGVNIDVVESVPTEEFESTFVEYGEKEYDLVMAAGSQFDDSCTTVASQYPNTLFSVINGQESESDNQVPIFPKEYEGSYLAGSLAGYYTKNGQFAVLGGESNAPMVKLMDTYEAMAIKTATDRGIAGASANRAFVNSFTDVSATKEMTTSMIDNGADTVFCYSNEGTSGAIQACAESNVSFVGFSSNKNSESDCVIGSVEMYWPDVYPTIIKNVLDGTWRGYQEIGVAEGVFKVDYIDNTPQDVQDAVASATQDIIDGKIDFTQYFTDK